MSPGPMAKHPSVRQRRNSASTARTIVLRDESAELLPVPSMPARWLKDKKTGELVELDYDDRVKVAWVEMWQYPLIYNAPPVDRHLIGVYAGLLQDFYERQMAGRALTEVSAELRAFAAEWGIGEKSRRTLQITIEQADEAITKGTQRRARTVESTAEEPKQLPEGNPYKPRFSEDDEDEGYIEEAQVVHGADARV